MSRLAHKFPRGGGEDKPPRSNVKSSNGGNKKCSFGEDYTTVDLEQSSGKSYERLLPRRWSQQSTFHLILEVIVTKEKQDALQSNIT